MRKVLLFLILGALTTLIHSSSSNASSPSYSVRLNGSIGNTTTSSEDDTVSVTITLNGFVQKNGSDITEYAERVLDRHILRWEIETWQKDSNNVEVPGTRITDSITAKQAMDQTFATGTINNGGYNPYSIENFKKIRTVSLNSINFSNGSSSLKFGARIRVYFMEKNEPIYQDATRSFYGFIPSEDLISGDELASLIGITSGTSQNSDAGWFHYELNGKTLYVSKKTFRHTISWDQINARQAVFGRNVIIEGQSNKHRPKTYKVRLLTSAEWNSLMYPLNSGASPDWMRYINSDLSIGTGNGRTSWVQDSSSSLRVTRGYTGVSSFSNYNSNSADSDRGWRPVLELVD
jgi:hypothetical protein